MPAPLTEIDRSTDRIAAALDAGVAEAVAYVRAHSPFYRERLASAAAVNRVADLRHLPIITKKDVSQFNRDFWCVDPSRFIDIATTSGTTGIPTLYPLTQRDLDRLGLNERLCFTQAGIDSNDVVILAVTLDKCFMAGLAYFEGLRQIGATVVRVGAGSPAMLLSMIDRLKPTTIVSVPSFLKRVASYAKMQNIDPAKTSVRKLICIGEPVRDAAFQLSPLGASIADSWNAKVFSTYGITELAASMCECEAGTGGHANPQLVHAEVLNDDGNPLADGEVGQLIATSIGVEAMPLVRFATGDMTFMTKAPCACGRLTPRIGPILGRKDQAMKIKGTTVYPAAVQQALGGIEQIIDYVMIATAGAALSDELEIVIALSNGAGIDDEFIREQLRGSLKVAPSVRIAGIKEVQSIGASGELRKQRVFLDRRTKNCSEKQ